MSMVAPCPAPVVRVGEAARWLVGSADDSRGNHVKYVPALDGLRAVAVFAVLALHASVPWARGGYLGVDVFFVLSGFLITRLLLEQGIDLKRFYLRRAMRLYPALLLMLAAYFIIAPRVFPEYVKDPLGDVLIAGLYLQDYVRSLGGRVMLLGQVWSLAVEEHFYLLWPIALAALLRYYTRTKAAWIMVAAFVALLLWRVLWLAHGQTWTQVYVRFDTHATGLALGCALALYGADRLPRWAGYAGVALLAIAATQYPWRGPDSLVQGITLAEIGSALLIAGIQRPGLLASVLSFGWLSYLGRLSYGIYLWHYPIFVYLREREQYGYTMIVGSLLTVALAALSYHTVEAFVRNLKQSRRNRVRGNARIAEG